MNQFARRRSWGPIPKYPMVENYCRVIGQGASLPEFVFIAGPCSVESPEHIRKMADAVSRYATHLRGGVFRAGTYPGQSFGWVDEPLLEAYADAARAKGMSNVIEVLDYTDRSLDMVSKYCDVFQVGARQMQNYSLLRRLGKYGKPVFLKRNPGATLDEWLGSAEHLLRSGVQEIALIERGSSTHLNHVRWDLSISMVPAVRAITSIPVIVDASHGTGRADLVTPMSMAGIAAGAGGVLVEVHDCPEKSLSDPDQALSIPEFDLLCRKAMLLLGVRS